MLRPVRAGMVDYRAVWDESLDLADFALMNDFLACEADNDELARDRAKRGN